MKTTALVLGLMGVVALSYWRDSQTHKQLEQITVQLASLRVTPETRACPSLVLPQATAEAAAPRAVEPGHPQPVVPTAKAEPTHEQVAALEAAQSRLDAALSRGRLASDDMNELHKQLEVAANPEEAREIGRRMAVAINLGKLIPADPTAH